MKRATAAVWLGAGLALTLAGFGLLADRALAERARQEQAAARAAARETARLTALSVRAALAQVEQAVAAQTPTRGILVDQLPEPPSLTAWSGFVPYGARPRAELARLLQSRRATPNGLPEAVVARLVLGDSPVTVGGQAAPDVAELLLSGLVPVRAADLRHLARRLGVASDPRVGALEERLVRGPAAGIPRLPAFLRVRVGERVEGWSRAEDLRFHYSVHLADLYERAKLGARLLPDDSAAGALVAVPDVPGLVLRVRGDEPGPLAGVALRVLLWVSLAACALVSVAVARALRREARATAREKAFLAGVTHELRTPLSALRLIGETLAGGRGDPREYGALVAQESERLEALVERVLAATRVDEAPSFAPLAAGALVSSALELIRPRAERRAVRLEARVAQGLPEVLWDGEAVRRALLSLLDNAVQHGRERGRVTVTAAADEGRLRLAVTDDGPGVARRDRRRIFGRFARGDGGAGTGLGLYLAEQVAIAHGGRIDLETEPGVGSTFALVLPVVPPAARPGAFP